jgi:hypothetical protein
MNDPVLIRNLTLSHEAENLSLMTGNAENTDENQRMVQILILDEFLGETLSRVLFNFHFPFRNVALKGFGTLQSGRSASDIIPLLKDNLSNQTQTLVIGCNSNAFKTCFDTFQFREKFFNTSLIQPSAGSSLDRLLLEVKRPWLQSIFIVGNQVHLSDTGHLNRAEAEGVRCIRLGSLRAEPGMVEPEIRSSDLVGLSLNALKHSEAPIQNLITSTGLTTEEACQLLYYAGRAEKNQITGIFDFLPSAVMNSAGMNLLATLIWYYLYGLNMRSSTYPPSRHSMKKYTLEHPVANKILTFYKDEKEQKWWLEAPFERHILSKEMPLIACDYQDYKTAANDQSLTERLYSWFQLYESGGLLKDGL